MILKIQNKKENKFKNLLKCPQNNSPTNLNKIDIFKVNLDDSINKIIDELLLGLNFKLILIYF